jgi:membrane associated rhomboid family serine protease
VVAHVSMVRAENPNAGPCVDDERIVPENDHDGDVTTLSAPSGQPSTRRVTSNARAAGFAVGVPLLLMWVLRVLDWVLPADFRQMGIRPRTLGGLEGILAAPFLHVSWSHLISNSFPFAVLGAVLALERAARFVVVFIVTALGSGVGTWLIAPSHSVHLGASGVIFGLLGYLLARGLFDRRVRSMAIGVAVGLFYGGLVVGVLPQNRSVSWQAHLFGFVSGVAIAYVLGKNERQAKKRVAAP